MYAYSNNGMSFRAWSDPSTIASGEVYFDHPPSPTELTAAFTGYAAAAAAQQAQASAMGIVAAGVSVQSASTPALNGTYAIDPASQARLTQEALYVTTTGVAGAAKFTNGQATKAWFDVTNAPHTFTTTQFTALAEALAQFVDALDAAVASSMAGGAWAPPDQPIQTA